MKTINKIRLFNFKRFPQKEFKFDDKLNLLIGDNEAGKSSILLALDLVLSGSRNKIETIGLENLFNIHTINAFFSTDKSFDKLPYMFIEIYLNEQNNPDLNGKNNSSELVCDGLRLSCEPMDEFSKDIKDILKQENSNFPFEFYSTKFTTFSGDLYSGYKKFIKHLVIDSSQINNEYATREYVKAIYNANVNISEKNKHQNEYRKHKSEFKDNALSDLNERLENYKFDIRTDVKSNLQTDLTITEDDIPIANKGKGRQCFIKTEFALQKNNAEQDLDILLLEEPENHLSHTNMKKLIQRISESENKQLFIATHNNLICTRLDLRKAIMLNSNSTESVLLNELSEQTAKFFIKAPDNNILEFVLSKKVILVEGDAEFILISALYKNITGEDLDDSGIQVISVGGTSFKRYMDIAKILKIKTAVVRDNDENYQANCIDNYSDYQCDNIEIFYEEDNDKRTFEICFYNVNQAVCNELFLGGRRTLTVQEYMLKNKADVAFELLDKKADELIAPTYIRSAIEWIKE
jgi:putative ATP-dependent endonuclease of the OLD family